MRSEFTPMAKPIAVIGAGVIGLTAALSLVNAGHKVIIVARNLPGDFSTEWASPWAGALLAPHPDAQFPSLVRASLKVYEHLARHQPAAGVKEVEVTEYYDDRPSDSHVWYEKDVQEFKRLEKADMLEGVTLGFRFKGMVANPNNMLPWLMSELKSKGVRVIHATVSSFDQVRKMTGADIIVNASGLGARELASDEKVEGTRGQTIFVKTANLDKTVIRQGSQYTYVIPRPSDGGVILGGVTQPGNTSSIADVDVREDILRRVNIMTGDAFADVQKRGLFVRDFVGFRPARKGGIRLEREGNIIHAYGLGSLGYLYAFGVAQEILELVDGAPKAKL